MPKLKSTANLVKPTSGQAVYFNGEPSVEWTEVRRRVNNLLSKVLEVKSPDVRKSANQIYKKLYNLDGLVIARPTKVPYSVIEDAVLILNFLYEWSNFPRETNKANPPAIANYFHEMCIQFFEEDQFNGLAFFPENNSYVTDTQSQQIDSEITFLKSSINTQITKMYKLIQQRRSLSGE